MRNSKKVAVHEFSRRSKAYATSSTLIDQSDLDTVVGLLNLSGNEIVLDVATGTGNLAMALSPHVKWVVGLDITPGMLGWVYKLHRREELATLPTMWGTLNICPLGTHHLMWSPAGSPFTISQSP